MMMLGHNYLHCGFKPHLRYYGFTVYQVKHLLNAIHIKPHLSHNIQLWVPTTKLQVTIFIESTLH